MPTGTRRCSPSRTRVPESRPPNGIVSSTPSTGPLTSPSPELVAPASAWPLSRKSPTGSAPECRRRTARPAAPASPSLSAERTSAPAPRNSPQEDLMGTEPATRRDRWIGLGAALVVGALAATILVTVLDAQRRGRQALEELQVNQVGQLSRGLD